MSNKLKFGARLLASFGTILFFVFLTACGSGSHDATTGITVSMATESAAASSYDLPAVIAKYGGRSATIVVSNRQYVNDLTVPGNIKLEIEDAGQICVSQGSKICINGGFEAPETPIVPVFPGSGEVAFGPASTHTAYPEWWLDADGDNAAYAIQLAINSLVSGDVVLGAKTYLLNRRVTMKLVDGNVDTVSAILVPKSGVNIRGRGYNSILKVADNFTLQADYIVFAPKNAETTSDITFSNFRIDGNGANNIVNGMAGNQVRRAMSIWLYAGSNVNIDNVWFENQPGTNVVKFGSDSLSYVVTDSTIANCTFNTVGGAIPGNRGQGDHSSIYASGRRVTVADNKFLNPAPLDANAAPSIVVAAIEMHGDDMMVTGNQVQNYCSGGYIVADGIVTANNQQWTGNSFTNMTKLGISIWSVGPVTNVLIDSNYIHLNGALDQCVAGIFQSFNRPDTTVGIDGIIIRNNTITSNATKPGTVWAGMFFTAARNTIIQDNVIEKMSSAGILLYGNTTTALDIHNITIHNNTIRDVGFNAYGAFPYAIGIVNNGLGNFSTINITENVFHNTLPLAAGMHGIQIVGSSSIAGVNIDRANRFLNMPNHDYWYYGPGRKQTRDGSSRIMPWS